MAEMRRCAGQQFDPAVVEALEQIVCLKRKKTEWEAAAGTERRHAP